MDDIKNSNILVVEDDPDINRLLAKIVENGGYQCRCAFSGSEAMLLCEQYRYDLVLLDLMLPGLTGEEFIEKVRRIRTMPIIVVSAKPGLEERVNALRLGADDFISKPFDNREVLARVEAQLRRSRQFSTPVMSGTVLTAGELTLDKEQRTLTAHEELIPLTAREFDILALLMTYPKRAFSRAQIYEQVWGEEFLGDDNTVNVHISNLRGKLARAGDKEYIKTIWGIGFKLGEL